MTDVQFQDLKQFIEVTVSQSEVRLSDCIDRLEKKWTMALLE